ncbi:hypothetical protein R3P38DRAFT_3215617 [Favolaschia claudopus]|uniref:Uncharacterized protein n=1 Tax=Favolaschia claudopus TaxID=2862362 RepID=A0AAW0A998_9AGAR
MFSAMRIGSSNKQLAVPLNSKDDKPKPAFTGIFVVNYIRKSLERCTAPSSRLCQFRLDSESSTIIRHVASFRAPSSPNTLPNLSHPRRPTRLFASFLLLLKLARKPTLRLHLFLTPSTRVSRNGSSPSPKARVGALNGIHHAFAECPQTSILLSSRAASQPFTPAWRKLYRRFSRSHIRPSPLHCTSTSTTPHGSSSPPFAHRPLEPQGFLPAPVPLILDGYFPILLKQATLNPRPFTPSLSMVACERRGVPCTSPYTLRPPAYLLLPQGRGSDLSSTRTLTKPFFFAFPSRSTAISRSPPSQHPPLTSPPPERVYSHESNLLPIVAPQTQNTHPISALPLAIHPYYRSTSSPHNNTLISKSRAHIECPTRIHTTFA